ncbi:MULTISPECIES: twin-arginine translocase subunit TatC [Vogesella]|jgi:sec-independent protein translocase protein TatC|uniref:Sec-independent protein translocase protein TatC n=1 Tax=Vogesella indigofera TaxID=45465 RepID=A0ABT5I744_VOGIN|nr:MULTISPECIES: twin-arginine translocase subunit TatC [Vogesella]MCQ4145658.1 twin-arginine translocase subunit TatC [Vogesella sp. AC12]MDC7691705.1 twin-arginine translocase subunit TatC [Vogesella indigofera]MDC7698843.1 twin-arginine translocase subunit TatC [Vogesella indigofera]MDC7702366.1 twin-arginine translocase subunit TatC [Vogesella indigofera]
MSDQQPLLAHLIELRSRVVRITLGIVVCFLALFHWSGDIYHLLAKPMLDVLPAGTNMIATDVTAPFFVPVKVTMLVAFLLSLPNTMYQIWAFVAPGLYNHEKRLVLPLVISSVLLFFVGMAFAYFAVFPVVFGFMSAVTPEGVSMMTDIDKYLSFVLGMFVAFGVTFEVPIVVIVLHRMGVVSLAQLREGRPYVIVGAFVIAAVVTPPDVLSQIMMAVPLWLLYEAGILMAVLTGRQTEVSHD